MKNYLTRKLVSLMALTLLMAASILPGWASAAGASISLTANKSVVAAGGSVIVAIYMNGAGTAINAVQADLSYSSAKLQYVGYSANGSAFEIGAASGGSDGLASVARGTVSAVTGSALVGTMTFKALATSGSAAISVAGSSSLVSDGNPVAYSSSGVNLTFGAAAAAPASGGPAAPVAPAPPKDTTPPVISDIKVKDLTPFSATITWTTNEASDSAVDYGLDAHYGLSTSAGPAVTAHVVMLNSAFLTPQTVLHYRVKSTDGAGNVATGSDQTLQLAGVPITVVVRGANGKPQAGASVTLDGASGTTDVQGSVTLPSSLGNKQITSTYGGVTVRQPITVTKSAKPLPPYQLDLAKQPLNHWMLTSIGLAVVVLTLLVIDAVLFGSRLVARLTGLRLRSSSQHSPALAPAAEQAPAPLPTPTAAEPEPAAPAPVLPTPAVPPPPASVPASEAAKTPIPLADKPTEAAVDAMLALVPESEPQPRPEPLPVQSSVIRQIPVLKTPSPKLPAKPRTHRKPSRATRPIKTKTKTAPPLPH